MADPGLIQSRASGLLSFLGVKGGEQPATFGAGAVGVVSLEHFYAANNLEAISSTNGAGLTTVDQGATIQVPQNECWRMVAVGYTCGGLTAAQELAIALNITQGLTVYITATQYRTIAAATESVRNGVLLPQPIILAPGTFLGAVLCRSLTAGTVNVGLTALVQRLSP